MTRRDLLKATVLGSAAFSIPIRVAAVERKPLRLAVIADLHHGLAPDAFSRLESFVHEVRSRSTVDLVLQMGDFCYSQQDSQPALKLWSSLSKDTFHVLGNHDMDKCDKDTAIKAWGMKARFYSEVVGGYRFLVLDLNHFKKDGKLQPYANGNYFIDNATHNWADPEQLAWLSDELGRSKEPVIIVSHQPLGFAEPKQPLPPEQEEVLRVIRASDNVAACLCGHMHVDRLESYAGIPCYCVNSASYFWYGGMNPYTKPLFAFMEITSEGLLRVEGVRGEFIKPPPSASSVVLGRSASISDRSLALHAHRRRS